MEQRGHDLIYLSLDPPPDAELQAKAFHQIPFLLKQRKGFLFWLLFSTWLPLYLVFFCFKAKPDRTVSFHTFYAVCLLPSALLLRIPVISFVRSVSFRVYHFLGSGPLVRGTAYLCDWVGLKGSSKIVSMTESMRRELVDSFWLPPERLVILPNDLPKLPERHTRSSPPHHPPPEPIQCVIAGVFDSRKNLTLIARAIEHLPEPKRQQIHFHLYGKGPELEPFLSKTAHHGCVTAHGWVSDLPWEARDLLVHPSQHEGMANVVLEALAAGVPVLLSDTPEQRELLEDDLFYFPLTDPEELSSKLCTLVDSSEAWSSLANAAIERRKKFDFDWLEIASSFVVD